MISPIQFNLFTRGEQSYLVCADRVSLLPSYSQQPVVAPLTPKRLMRTASVDQHFYMMQLPFPEEAPYKNSSLFVDIEVDAISLLAEDTEEASHFLPPRQAALDLLSTYRALGTLRRICVYRSFYVDPRSSCRGRFQA